MIYLAVPDKDNLIATIPRFHSIGAFTKQITWLNGDLDKVKLMKKRSQDEDFPSFPTGVEPMAFQIPVWHPNHLALGDSRWARSYTRFLCVCITHACIWPRSTRDPVAQWEVIGSTPVRELKKSFFNVFDLRTLLYLFFYPSHNFIYHFSTFIISTYWALQLWKDTCRRTYVEYWVLDLRTLLLLNRMALLDIK